LLTLFSCKKEQEINQSQFTLDAAQNWFADYSSMDRQDPRKNLGRIGGNISTSTIKKQLFWEKAIVKRIFDKDVLTIPVWNEKNYRMGKQAIRQLWIYKNNQKQFEARIVELLATREYLNTHTEIKYKDFSGSVTFHDWHTGFRSGYQMENGKKIGNIIEYSIGNKSTRSNSGRVDSYCGGYYNNRTYYEPLCSCLGVIVNYVPIDCSFQPISEPYNYAAWVDYNYGCEVTQTCTAPNSDWYFEPEPEPVEVLSIYNQTQSPCIKSAVDRLSDTNLANKINVLIHNVFWDSPNVNLTIIEDPNLTVDGNPHEAATTRAQHLGQLYQLK